MPTAFDNQQASLVLGQVLQLQGVYPSPGDAAGDTLSPLLGVIRTVAFDYQGAEAQGQLLTINQHQMLFSVLGVQFGGDGHTTFQIPDLRGRLVAGPSNELNAGMWTGAESVTLTSGQLPSGGSPGQAVQNQQPAMGVRWIIRLHDGDGVAAGEMLAFVGGQAPAGFAFATGATLAKSEFPDLFARIGTTYGGSGLGFNLPDLSGRTIVGADTQTAVGTQVGSASFALTTPNLPAELGGSAAAIDNRAPGLAMNYYVRTTGSFTHGDGPLEVNPIGEVRAFAGTAPNGWQLANGAALPMHGNEMLYSLLGGTFGQTANTFNLPDLRGRVVVGAGPQGGHDHVVGQTLGSNSLTLGLAEMPLVAPVNTAPGSVTAEMGSGTYVFGDSVLKVADSDSATLTVKLMVGQGTLKLDEAGDLQVTGDGTGTLTLQGSVAALNGGLTGITYQANGGYRGADALTMVTTDGVLSDTDMVWIRYPNVAPVVTADQVLTAPENQIWAGQVVATDINGGLLTYSLYTGVGAPADTGLFTINALGFLQFVTAPNFEGAHAPTYSVGVVATDTAGATSPMQTVTVNVTDGNDMPTGSVTVAGAATQGAVLTATNTLADQDGINGQITYQWLAAGQAISGATGSTLTLAQAQVGKMVTVTASYTDGGGRATSVTSTATSPVANVNDAPTGAVSVSGAAQVGATLTANHTLADADGLGAVTWQWSAGGVAISGATGASLVLGADLVGKAISVAARYTDALGTSESVASTATAAVAAVAPPPIPEPPAPPPPPPPLPPPLQVIDGVSIQSAVKSNADGSVSSTIKVPVVDPLLPNGQPRVDPITVPLTGAADLLAALIPTGFSLEAEGMSGPGPLNDLLATMSREMADAMYQAELQRTLDALQSMLQQQGAVNGLAMAVTVSARDLAGAGQVQPMTLAGQASGPLTALVINGTNAPSGMPLALQHIAFATVLGPLTLTGGAGRQIVFADGANQTLNLGEDDDELHGGGGDDVVGSQGGDDTLTGDAGRDTVTGGEGADLLMGGEDADFAHGNQGADYIQGNAGADTLYGGQGDDIVLGGRDADFIWGDLGGDRLFGDLGADTLNGNLGADTLNGGDGADVLSGGQDGDRLMGDAGDDRLWGDRGADTLTGGAGADLFMISANSGADVITDFDLSSGDRLVLDAGLRGAAWTVTATASGDAAISVAGGGSVVLLGVAASAVTAAWFV